MTFLSAHEARNTALNQMVIFTEIQLIEKGIMTASSSGELSAVIGPDSDPAVVSGMTNNSVFYNAYAQPFVYTDSEYKIAREQMDKVVNHFQLKGYVIKRELIDNTTTFNWVVTW